MSVSDLSVPLDALIAALARAAAEDYLRSQAAQQHNSNDERAERVSLLPPADAA